MTRSLAFRFGAYLPVALALLATVPALGAAPPAPGAGPGAGPGPAGGRPPGPPPAPDAGQSSHSETPAQPPVSQDAAARTRMHECGHQWSSLKKAGNTGTLTWKEFSATCLAYNK